METKIYDLIVRAVEKYDSNYFEFNILNSNGAKKVHDEVTHFDTSLTKDTFYKIMQNVSTDDLKFYQKTYKESTIGSTIYQNSKNEEINISNVETNFVALVADHVCLFGKTKHKLTILSLPSTNHIHYEVHIKRLILKVTNRIFINFEHGVKDDNRFYRIYINYNHDKDVDLSSVAKTIERTLKKLDV